MLEIIIYLSSIIFGLCSAFLMGISELFNLTYEEVSVYVNLYFQYIIILLSCVSLLWVSLKHFKISFEYILNTFIIFIYNCVVIKFGFILYERYGTISVNDSFNLCKNDLMYLAEHIKLNINNPYYREGWTEYFIVNILIFIIGFLGILIINKIWKNILKNSR